MQLLAADNFSRRHFQMHFFLGALRVKVMVPKLTFISFLKELKIFTSNCDLLSEATFSFLLNNFFGGKTRAPT